MSFALRGKCLMRAAGMRTVFPYYPRRLHAARGPNDGSFFGGWCRHDTSMAPWTCRLVFSWSVVEEAWSCVEGGAIGIQCASWARILLGLLISVAQGT